MRKRKKLTLMPLACAIGSAFASSASHAQVLPVGPSVVAGKVNVSAPTAQQLVVNQQSNRAIVNWSSFSLGTGTRVNFVQPGSSSAILNRVTGDSPSSIAGQVSANGQVFLVNPNGMQITSTGSVQAAGLTLSSLDIANGDFLDGRLAFTGSGASAAVSNAGMLRAAQGGYVALLGGQVSNEGRIEASLGRIGLGSGERATLDLLGSRFLQVALPTARDAEGRALVEVSGMASAEGGRIEVSAATAREALRQAVNIPGALVARSAAGRSGDIVLSAGSGGNAAVSGQIDASGGEGVQGGNVTITGESITLQRARIDAFGGAGGGTVQLGGGMQGQGLLPHANRLQMDADSVVKADATVEGNGGRIVLWSDERTGFQGTLTARGAGRGAGGLAEVSSQGLLQYAGQVDLRAERGRTGTLLLDPFDVTISTGADTGACCSATSNDTVINTTTLANALASANVTVSTGAAGAQNGDITVANAVSWNSGNVLTLSAARDVNVNAAISGNGGLQLTAGRNIAVNSDITATGGPLNVGLTASASTGSIAINGGTISTASGNLTVTATQNNPAIALQLIGATLDVGSGTGTITVNSDSNNATYMSGNVQLLAAAGGSIALNSTSNSSSGIHFSANTTLSSAGSVSLTGASTGDNGIFMVGTNTVISGSGSLSLAGSSVDMSGVWFNGGANTLTATGGLSITGTSVNLRGVGLNTGATLATSGSLSLAGISTNETGFWLNGTNGMSANNGTLTLSGSSTAGSGVFVNDGANTLTQAGTGSIALNASSGTGGALVFNVGTSLTTGGNISLSGNSSGMSGVLLPSGTAITAASGSLALAGSSGTSSGVQFAGTNSLVNTGATSFSVTGSTASLTGIDFASGAALTTSGDVVLTGSGGIAGVSLSTGASIANSGSGTLHLDAANGMNLLGDLSSPGGALWLTAGSAVNQWAGSVSASKLLLTGAGAFTLGAAGNQVQTLAANTGSLMLHSATDFASGTVLGTPGIATSGALTLLGDGNLTIAAGAPVSGASPVLSAGGSFVNNAGAGALTANSGRWLIYAQDPAASNFGGLDSGNTALWNATYGLTPPAGVAAVGNRYLFAQQPTLSFTPLDATKVYGTDASGAIQSSFTVAGFHPGVANAFLPDTAATAYSGAPLLASTGAAITAGVAGSPYALSVSAGTANSTAGYAMNFSATANLSVTPRPITVSADAQTRVYGAPNPTFTYSVSGGSLVNGDTVGGSLGTPANAASPIGNYSITQGTLDAGANYALAYVPANLTVTPRPITVSADAQSRSYGDINPLLTYRVSSGSLVNGDTLGGSAATAANVASAVGNYSITQGTLDAGANYALAYVPANLTVTQRPITVSADAQTRVYGNTNPSLTYRMSSGSLVNGDTLVGNVGTAAKTSASTSKMFFIIFLDPALPKWLCIYDWPAILVSPILVPVMARVGI